MPKMSAADTAESANTAAGTVNSTPRSRARKNRIGPVSEGKPASQPATPGPQRRPATEMTPSSAGTRSSFSASSTALAFVGRNALDRCGEGRVRGGIHRTVLHLRARRVLAEIVVALPVPRRAHRPRHEAAAAVGADVLQHVLHAVAAERALVRADPSLR